MCAMIRTCIYVLTLTIALAFGEASAFAKGNKNKHSRGDRPLRGTVTAADRNSITIETKKNESKQFRLTPSTTIERLGKHGVVKPPKESKTGKSGSARKARKIKAGSRVEVTAKDGVAEKVSIKRNRHKGKKQ